MRRTLWVTYGTLWCERLWLAFWPLVAWILFGIGLARLIPSLSFAGIGVYCIIFLGLSVFGALRLHAPRFGQAIERVDATLLGRPLFSLMDAQATGNAELWDLQQVKLRSVAKNARPHAGHFQISHLDPFGLRFIALLTCCVGVLFGSGGLSFDQGRRDLGTALAANGGTWEGWIIPPEYTQQPTVYLLDVLTETPLSVFQGSIIELRTYSETDAWVDQDVTDQDVVDGTVMRIPIQRSGTLQITSDPKTTWSIQVEQDAPPMVQITSDFSADYFGASQLPYAAQDDFGVVSGRLLVDLDAALLDRRFGLIPDYQGPSTVEMPLAFSLRSLRTDMKAVAEQDFSESVWAHLPVRIRVEVTDGAGNTTLSEPLFTTLPARRFFDPLAASLIELRRDVLWSSENDRRALRLMRALTYKPHSEFIRETHYLLLRNIMDRWNTALVTSNTKVAREKIAQDLWSLAMAIEEGDVDDALARMRKAQERLSEAIKNGASPEEIEKLMQDLRAANENYLRQLRQEAERDMAEMTPEERSLADQDQMQMSMDQLQEMMDRIQDLMEQGRMAEAMQALDEFQDMVENMQMAQSPQGGESGTPSETLDDLSNTLREQQGLSDQAFDQLQDQFNGTPSDQSGDDLAQRQQDLQNQLNRQRDNLPNLDGKAARDGQRALRQAQEAMKDAERALREENLDGALDRQAEAMDALREGIKSIDQAMAENSENGQGTNQQNAGGERSDPLGRSQGVGGQNGNSDASVGDADIDEKQNAIMDEIRRRTGDLERSDKERDYLKRLLERF